MLMRKERIWSPIKSSCSRTQIVDRSSCREAISPVSAAHLPIGEFAAGELETRLTGRLGDNYSTWESMRHSLQGVLSFQMYQVSRVPQTSDAEPILIPRSQWSVLTRVVSREMYRKSLPIDGCSSERSILSTGTTMPSSKLYLLTIKSQT
jgi:hypothetical protein